MAACFGAEPGAEERAPAPQADRAPTPHAEAHLRKRGGLSPSITSPFIPQTRHALPPPPPRTPTECPRPVCVRRYTITVYHCKYDTPFNNVAYVWNAQQYGGGAAADACAASADNHYAVLS